MDDTPHEEAQESTELFETLKRSGFRGRDAHYLIKSIEEMAAANLIHRFEAAQKAEFKSLNAKLEGQDSRFRMMQWVLGIGLGVIALLLSLATFLISNG